MAFGIMEIKISTLYFDSEIQDNILGCIPARESDIHNSEFFDDNFNSNSDYSSFPNEDGTYDCVIPPSPRLRPDFASVCSKFQLGIERSTFRSIFITSDDVEFARTAFRRCRNRQNSLRSLDVEILRPQYQKCSSSLDIVEDMARGDKAYTEAPKNLMLMLSEWQDGARISLIIGSRERTTAKYANLYHLNVLNPQLFPVVACLKSYQIAHFDYEFLMNSPRNFRRNIEGDFHLTQKFPNVESFNLKTREFPFFIRPRREMR
ncbi:hypothetical protein CSAL01_08925 [Colletotrichum salicis]|uniref:Uncharacterized protein n=1 Tax=Colletotrichum salicis TaxID=1209931 RepID=A0A135SPB4_9PEZI|nr:hypothetical protein CSAL01_08925 [Colletotrichum salicis]